MYPIITLSITGLLTLFLGLTSYRKALLPFSLLSIIVALVSNFFDWGKPGLYFGDMIAIDNFVLLVQSIILFSSFLIISISDGLFKDEHSSPAEYYALIQFTVIGALLMVAFKNFIMLFVGLEILSVGLYILAGVDKRNLRGNEAALKYFLMGSFATGILLFGIAMYYGATGTFDIDGGLNVAGRLPEGKIFFYIGITFILVGMLFKISAVPFHFWTADVYQGSPTIFTAYMATVVKTAGIFALLKLTMSSFSGEYPFWSKILVVVVALSLFVGNIAAVYQSNMKRMLAFSSISQAGFMLLSLLGLNGLSYGNLAYYSLSYALATVGSFGVLMIISSNVLENGRPKEDFDIFNGLMKKQPVLAIVLIVSMLSLSGIPLTSGFWSKFFVLNDAAGRGYSWLLVFGIIMSAISVYFYFKPIRAVFKDPNPNHHEIIEVNSFPKIILLTTALLSIILGVFPNIFRGLF